MKQVTIVIPDRDANLSSISGTFQILTRANQYWQRLGNEPMIEVRIASFVKEVRLEDGFFSIHPINIKDIKKTDLVIIPAISYDFDNIIKKNKELIDWVRQQYLNGAEIATICTGAFLLASTGLLDGQSCSIHWNTATDFKQRFPNIDIHTDRLITVGPRIYTNGGAFSFLNLVLFLVEKFFDRETAIHCSKIFQIDIERTSQSPFSIFQPQKNHGDELVSKVQTFIEENLGEKISFEDLASRLAISRRNFDRRFVKAVGNTPMEYLQRVKIEVAKRLLEKERTTIFEVMFEVGYSDDKAFREVFKKLTGLSPLDYKARYNKQPVAV